MIVLVLHLTDPREWNRDPGGRTWSPTGPTGTVVLIPEFQIFVIKVSPVSGRVRIRADRTYRVNSAAQLAWVEVQAGAFV